MIFNGIVLLFLIFLALMIIVPLGWMIISGFKTNNDLFTNSFGMPREWMVSNYKLAWQVGVGKYFFNSIFVTVVSTALTVLVSSMAAFSLTTG